jgi:hypothetical protein
MGQFITAHRFGQNCSARFIGWELSGVAGISLGKETSRLRTAPTGCLQPLVFFSCLVFIERG